MKSNTLFSTLLTGIVAMGVSFSSAAGAANICNKTCNFAAPTLPGHASIQIDLLWPTGDLTQTGWGKSFPSTSTDKASSASTLACREVARYICQELDRRPGLESCDVVRVSGSAVVRPFNVNCDLW